MLMKSNNKILITTSSFANPDRSPLERLEAEGWVPVLNPFGRKLTKPEVIELLRDDVVGIVAGLEPLDREVLAGSKLAVVSRCGSGIANVDLEAARELGIGVECTPDAPTAAVAELTLGACLTLLRSLREKDTAVREGRWDKTPGRQLGSMTVAVVGMGRIGRRVAALFGAFGAKVIGVDPGITTGVAGDVPIVPLDQALQQADIVSLHAAGETCLIGPPEFERFKDGSYLLSAGRGALVDEEALMAALDRGTLAGAWLDVFSEEPYSGPLTRYPQVLLTPHVGSYTLEGRRNMEMEAVNNLIAALERAGAGV